MWLIHSILVLCCQGISEPFDTGDDGDASSDGDDDSD